MPTRIRTPKTCYACDALATSREHAPPLCFFPDPSNFGEDLRRNLITVPSCDLHNSRKSGDDELFRLALMMTSGPESDVASHLFFGKVLRAKDLHPDEHHEYLRSGDRRNPDGYEGLKLDRDRFDRSAQHLVRAIYFDTFKTQWTLNIAIVVPGFLLSDGEQGLKPHPDHIQAAASMRHFLADEPVLGDNPKVFSYKIRFQPELSRLGFGALFFGRAEPLRFFVSTIRSLVTASDSMSRRLL